jgi:hypothetical protein
MSEIRSIVPSTTGGTHLTRLNALKHGVLSRYTVLPWEEPEEYQSLLESLVAEHAPLGPTEEHLVEELAGIIWRKRRLRLAEGAAHRQGLRDALSPFGHTAEAAVAHLAGGVENDQVGDAIRASPEDSSEFLKDIAEDESKTRRALEALGSDSPEAYESALLELRDDTRVWWEETVEDEDDVSGFTADRASLVRFLQTSVLPWYEARRNELVLRPLIREQALGEALDPNRLERLARYEVHLDRKLERMLAMLIRLKDLRGEAVDT